MENNLVKMLPSRFILPPRLKDVTLENFETARDPVLTKALRWARSYVDEFVPGKTKLGLLFAGTVGTGKTHLAIGIARALVETKGIEARFVNMGDFWLSLGLLGAHHGYEPSWEHEAHMLQAWRDLDLNLNTAELVVIDDLGLPQLTPVTSDIYELLIGQRLYNAGLPTLVTTNYPPVAGKEEKVFVLSDKIGVRMSSRLQQMCRVLEMVGLDWRLRQGRGA